VPRHPQLAQTALGLSDRVYSPLALKAGGRPDRTFPLHVGDTYLDPPPGARAEAQRVADHPRLHNYAPVQGEPALLAAVARRLAARRGVRVDPDCIQVMPGATAGLAIVAAALLDPGDEVVLPSPFWPLIRGIIASRGCTPVEVPFFTRLETPGFDAEAALEAAIGPRTVALYVNSPHNPTGRILRGEVVDAVARVAARHDLWVLADEAYEELVYGDPAPAIWTRDDLRDRTIAVHTLSKSYALAGARVGFVHGPADAMQAIRGVQTFTNYCAARPMQLAAVRALDEGDAWLATTREAYRAAAIAAAAAVGVQTPEAGTFIVFDAAPHFATGEGLDGFLERCLEQGVLLTPGRAVGRDFGTWVRLCFTAVAPADLQEALSRLARVLRPRGSAGPL
jgi:N-succinyldiaminopimelate aminotransferase